MTEDEIPPPFDLAPVIASLRALADNCGDAVAAARLRRVAAFFERAKEVVDRGPDAQVIGRCIEVLAAGESLPADVDEAIRLLELSIAEPLGGKA